MVRSEIQEAINALRSGEHRRTRTITTVHSENHVSVKTMSDARYLTTSALESASDTLALYSKILFERAEEHMRRDEYTDASERRKEAEQIAFAGGQLYDERQRMINEGMSRRAA